MNRTMIFRLKGVELDIFIAKASDIVNSSQDISKLKMKCDME